MPEIPSAPDKLFRLTMERSAQVEQLIELVRVITPVLKDGKMPEVARKLEQMVTTIDEYTQTMNELVRTSADQLLRAADAIIAVDAEDANALPSFRRRPRYPGADS